MGGWTLGLLCLVLASLAIWRLALPLRWFVYPLRSAIILAVPIALIAAGTILLASQSVSAFLVDQRKSE